jgi:hypothetical protein
MAKYRQYGVVYHCSVVDFTHILQATFCHSFLLKYTVQTPTVGTEKLLVTCLYEKAARKIMMKMTPGLWRQHQLCSQSTASNILSTFCLQTKLWLKV